ncbi:NAD(P)/FAD-dependent oxidoreductase, partial [candidate division WOR-3 bacterium]|nr:NAD(P)/FAD-dependent oxidoreductase [candidate division WOR-3 bacterium]
YYPDLDVDNIDNKVIVYGGGDIAFDYALTLRKTINNISIYCRNKIKANRSLMNEVVEKDIKYDELSEISELSFKKEMIDISFKNGITIKTNYLVIAIGRKPNNELINSMIDNRNLFRIGDANNDFRQLVCAASDGIKAIMEISQRENNGC